MRKFILLATIVIGAVYSASWYFYAHTLRAETEDFIADLATEDDIIVTLTALEITNFPLIPTVHTGGRIEVDGHVIEIPTLEVKSMFYPGHTLAITAHDGIRLLSSSTPENWTIDYLYLDTIIPQTFPNDFYVEDLSAWRDAGGHIPVREYNIKKQELDVRGGGIFDLDEDLQPSGRLSAVMTGHTPFIGWLESQGIIEPRAAIMANIVLNSLAQAQTQQQNDETPGETQFRIPEGGISANVTIQNRTFYLGPMRVASFPRFQWAWRTPVDPLR